MRYRVFMKTDDEGLCPSPVNGEWLEWKDALVVASYAVAQFTEFSGYVVEVRDENGELFWGRERITYENERFKLFIQSGEETQLSPEHEGWLEWEEAKARANVIRGMYGDRAPYVIEIRDQKGELRWRSEYRLVEE